MNEDDFPEEYRHIIRRLKQAAESEEIKEQMTAEDELISEFQEMERQIAARDEIIEENKKDLEEKDKKLEEKDKKLEEKDKIIKELLRELNQN